MATLVLSSVGTAIGGPFGGSIGALIGQSIDGALFAPKREGPRLDSLAVQSSRYGAALPLLFGATRVAGTVIWATDLAERRSTTGGKGKPKVTSYSYFADFAVALSARPIQRIGRIWADGTLLTRADGSLSVDGRMRLHAGGEDQAPDPLIEAEEGRGRAPAYRGLAYVVFEELALEGFGNRVPMLSFEVFADAGPLALAPVVGRLSDGALGGDGSLIGAAGAAFAGGTRREALAGLAEPLSLAVGEADGRAVLRRDGSTAAAPPVLAGLGAADEGEERPPRLAIADRPAATSVAFDFAEPARDYQPGRQRAATGGADARPEERQLPLVLDAARAKALAVERLDRARGAARRAAVALPFQEGLALAPGDIVRLPDAPGRWGVVDWLLERGVVRLELEPVVAASASDAPADGGRAVPAVPPPGAGRARLELLDLPWLADGARAYVALGRDDGSDRPLPLLLERAGGTEPIGPSAPAAALGTVEVPPAGTGALLFDRTSRLVVALPPAADLMDADADRLSAGANAALVGDEIVQWARAEPLGGGRWALTGLLRGRRGTEAAIGTARAGDRFVALDAATLQPLPADAGGALRVLAVPAGRDAAVAEAGATIGVGGPLPLSPVHPSARERADGGLLLGWVRRSRAGWAWRDGADAPLAEERERYLVTLSDGRSIEVGEPRLALAAAERVAGDRAFSVRQLGTHGRSEAAIHTGHTGE